MRPAKVKYHAPYIAIHKWLKNACGRESHVLNYLPQKLETWINLKFNLIGDLNGPAQ